MPDLRAFLPGGGETAELIRAATALDEIGSWPHSLRSILSICGRALATDLAGSAKIAFEPGGLACGIEARRAEAAPRAAA